MIMASALLWAHSVSACGCVASVPARNDRLRRASRRICCPPLCSTAGVYKFIMPSSGIRNRGRVCGFFSRIRPKPSAYEILRTVTTLLLSWACCNRTLQKCPNTTRVAPWLINCRRIKMPLKMYLLISAHKSRAEKA